MRIYLLRHAQTEWNTKGMIQGSSDIDLDEMGLGQVERLRHAFRPGQVQRIFSSDLSRARRTAEGLAAATGADVHYRPDLRERAMGEFEGRPFSEFHKVLAQRADRDDPHGFYFRPVGGESIQDAFERVKGAVEEIESLSENVAIVTHGATAALVTSRLIRGTVQTGRCFRFSNCGITEFERRNDGHWTMIRYDCTAHLADAPMVGSIAGSERA